MEKEIFPPGGVRKTQNELKSFSTSTSCGKSKKPLGCP
jgi:hypothetical protein